MQKICLTCASTFTPLRAWQIYCTPRCRNNAPRKKVVTQKFQKARRDWLNQIKVERGCLKCGYNANPVALDFNHVRGTKLFGLGQDPKIAMHKLLEEIAKCEILCANCHRIHTYDSRHWHTKRKGVRDD